MRKSYVMSKIVRVRFRPHGKVYNFDSGHFVLSQGDRVIVETEQGVAFGTVVSPPQPRSPKLMIHPLKPVYRLATQEDIEQARLLEKKEEEAYQILSGLHPKAGIAHAFGQGGKPFRRE